MVRGVSALSICVAALLWPVAAALRAPSELQFRVHQGLLFERRAFRAESRPACQAREQRRRDADRRIPRQRRVCVSHNSGCGQQLPGHGGSAPAPNARSVANGTGTLSADVTDIAVSCAAGAEGILQSVAGGPFDRGNPQSDLAMDLHGYLSGTTCRGGALGAGTVFALNGNGTDYTLHSFSGGTSDGANPHAGLIVDGDVLCGTTENGGLAATGIGGASCVDRSGCARRSRFPPAAVVWSPWCIPSWTTPPTERSRWVA